MYCQSGELTVNSSRQNVNPQFDLRELDSFELLSVVRVQHNLETLTRSGRPKRVMAVVNSNSCDQTLR